MLDMARAAARRGMKVIAFTDHSVSLGVTGGLSMEDHKKQAAEIKKIQKQLGDSILVLHASEVEIKADGTLDYPDEFLATLDLVVASLHTSLRQPREKVTQRVINAIRNPHVDIIGHPTGRLIPDREGADLDMEAVLKAAAETGVALEINARAYSSWYALGVAQYNLKQLPDAIESLRRAVSLNQKSINANLYLGTLLRHSGRLDEAETYLKQANLLAEAKVPDAHWQLALLFNQLKRFKEAADELELFLKAQPDARDADKIKKLIQQLRQKSS